MTHNDRIQNLHDQITAVHDALHKSLENFQSLVQPVVPDDEQADLQTRVTVLQESKDHYKQRSNTLADSLAEMTRDRDEWYEQYYDVLRQRDELNRSLDAVQEDLARVTQERDRLQDRIDTAIQELTRWQNPQAAVDALTDYDPGDEDDEFDPWQFEQGVQRTQVVSQPSRTVRWARYTPDSTVYRVFGFRGTGEYDVYGLDGIRRTLHGDDLEPWHPRDGEWITGENWTRTSLVTGTYDSTYRTHAAPEGCVAVCVRPSVYVWAHLDSLYPVRGGDQG